ncbi:MULTISPECIES: YgdI/YgdR family lipoprotein [unclassified Pseudomonas]|uniref:YgdI/YgdR family lipoprotein n=1 Tax=unclassified Pseudomonas TaxID=196821 RepID=UPI00245426F4|nr:MULTISPECIES: YgdI/YgdR family lipoprotein [unclassified Pseudomonas]MDH4559848.1 YgdI/YgdR family lipoprotein [Pseudomonas sp. BN411]MDH4872818.1 YgdI/YgdR family lipoprotein [Pseudomonas sp. BN515]
MKTWFLILTCTLGLAGCSSEYLIATTDGQLIATDEKPELDRDTGMLEFEDHEGRTQQIPQNQVKQIIER